MLENLEVEGLKVSFLRWFYEHFAWDDFCADLHGELGQFTGTDGR